MSERVRRIAQNEVLFRTLNERIDNLNERFGTSPDVVEIVCECGRGDCVERIELDPGAYRRLREEPFCFAVVRGHEYPSSEAVVGEADGYVIVEKRPGEPQDAVEAADPEL
jgi:hypothetical protein